ncbi:MAG TPA: pyridine nucleotide-disulfide oxidoreductase, partial [Sphingomicrobium sp.]|nr:pyridine nucleotide-disulfide oxidoreductase [Sphingomicrobium sp.]
DASPISAVTILGRRGPLQISMTPKELGELGHLDASTPVVDAADFPPDEADEALEPGQRKSVSILREFAADGPDGSKSTRMIFDFFAKPLRIEGEGKAERIIVERTKLDAEGRAAGTGETYEVPASLVITSIGYSTPPMEGVPYDESGGKFLNENGKIDDRLYCVGWARRGPTGTIGTNRPDGYEVAARIEGEMPPGSSSNRRGAEGLKALLGERGVMPTDYDDWRKIERTETERARPGAPREKFVRAEDWLKVVGR